MLQYVVHIFDDENITFEMIWGIEKQEMRLEVAVVFVVVCVTYFYRPFERYTRKAL